MANLTSPPSDRVVIPSNAPNRVKVQQTASLISHIAKLDNHLWQALTSLQTQANSIVANTTDWTSWNPKIYDSTNVPLKTTELSAYYMVHKQLLFIELFGLVTFANSPDIRIDLPMDTGETITKTCAAYVYCPPIFSEGNGVVIARVNGRVFQMFVRAPFENQTCDVAIGGAIGIIQGKQGE